MPGKPVWQVNIWVSNRPSLLSGRGAVEYYCFAYLDVVCSGVRYVAFMGLLIILYVLMVALG